MIRMRTLALAFAGLALGASGAAAADGRQLFLDNCSACHQVTGKGIPGAFPALAGSKVALGPAPAAASIVLNGKGGMPAFRDDLSDADIAAVLSYVRTAWGNKAPPLTAALVNPVRRTGKRENPKAALTAH
ncbi:MAG: c-type cytochrome [Phenylobacterium sp.]|uniref:c-type cytochrome n=1 Tax=Phenylobacterium sp. TaxID=1871053 RepID=UPI00391C9C31